MYLLSYYHFYHVILPTWNHFFFLLEYATLNFLNKNFAKDTHMVISCWFFNPILSLFNFFTIHFALQFSLLFLNINMYSLKNFTIT